MNISGVVLAGGRSRRMGKDKRFLSIQGRPLITWVLESLTPLVSELIIVTKEPEDLETYGVRVVQDHYSGIGVLAGLHAGLVAAQGEWAFVVAADSPFLNVPLMRAIVRLGERQPVDVVVPYWQKGLEPLCALYRPVNCVPAIESAIQRGDRRLISFYSDLRVQIMAEEEVSRWDPQGCSFFNVNTPQDLETVQCYPYQEAPEDL
ncbi:MAG: molybdenum cofactor guanylyltransferase [Anaerolineae bacterium]|nr:molybdenum cofactor guanylyltransferase [Anaerolineae bacterium]